MHTFFSFSIAISKFTGNLNRSRLNPGFFTIRFIYKLCSSSPPSQPAPAAPARPMSRPLPTAGP